MNRKYFSIITAAVIALGLSSFVASDPAKNSSTAQAEVNETVNWVSFEEALELQKKTPKPIMMDVYTSWCGPCKMLDKNTFQDPRVAKYLNENFYSVKFNAEGPDSLAYQGVTYKNPNYQPNQPGRNGVHEFTMALGVNSYPTIFFMDKTGQPLMPLVGYRTPAQIELYLHLFASEKYREITTQEQFAEYENSFKVTWN
jgi:thioredoxin-related protein